MVVVIKRTGDRKKVESGNGHARGREFNFSGIRLQARAPLTAASDKGHSRSPAEPNLCQLRVHL